MNARIAAWTAAALLVPLLPASADIIPPESHLVARCASIVNLDDFPDIVVFALVCLPLGSEELERYVVYNDTCLEKGYKYNTLYLYWTTREHFEATGLSALQVGPLPGAGLEKTSMAPVSFLSDQINPWAGYVSDSNPLVSEDLEYSLYETETGFGVYLSRRISRYDDETERMEMFVMPVTRAVPFESHRGSGTGTVSLNGGYLFYSPAVSGPIAGSVTGCSGRQIAEFTRDGRAGCTYVHALGDIGAGFYWVRLRTSHGDITRRLQVLR